MTTKAMETLHLQGLQRAVEVITDQWGIAHIFAATDADAFFGQGFCAARDRLWQIDLWRKRHLGLLAGDYGAAYLQHDLAARQLLYRGDMDVEWACYGPDARRWTVAFVAGINAYIDLVNEQPERMPVEFSLCGTLPARWAVDDVVRVRAHARVRNVATEIERANIIADYGVAATELQRRYEPEWTLQMPDGVVLDKIPKK